MRGDSLLCLEGDPWPYRKKPVIGLLILLGVYATLARVLHFGGRS